MEFHGIFHGIPWNSTEFYMEFHGIMKLRLMEFHGISSIDEI
jgi:hypothetical protein